MRYRVAVRYGIQASPTQNINTLKLGVLSAQSCGQKDPPRTPGYPPPPSGRAARRAAARGWPREASPERGQKHRVNRPKDALPNNRIPNLSIYSTK